MKSAEAVGWLEPDRWKATPPAERLQLLGQIQVNLDEHYDELARVNGEAMKTHGVTLGPHEQGTFIQSLLVSMAGAIVASIELYEALVNGEAREPLGVTAVGNGEFDLHVSPRGKDRLLYSDRTDVLRVKGTPTRHDPYGNPAGIVAVLGAGNVASPFELIQAIFYDGYTVVHKPHHINEAIDSVWQKIFQPLIEVHALSFCPASEGRELTGDPRLSKIYFTGGTPAAKAIMKATDTELVSECGGNNPCIIIPGDRPWSDSEIHHQALQIATMMNILGGSVCGRIQTLVTSARWPQRRQLLDAIVKVMREETPAASAWYPGTDKTFAAFRNAYPNARVIQPKGHDQAPNSEMLFIEDVGTEGFALEHEAFCQVMSEVALDVPADAATFTPAAVEFCNEKLLGTLASSIIVDEHTKKAHASVVDDAVTALRYGAVGVNTMPPTIWSIPYLTWGGNEEGREFASGRGNFGNGLGYDNVAKSIVTSGFTSPSHLIINNKHGWLDLSNSIARYSIEPTWRRFLTLARTAATSRFRRVDF